MSSSLLNPIVRNVYFIWALFLLVRLSFKGGGGRRIVQPSEQYIQRRIYLEERKKTGKPFYINLSLNSLSNHMINRILRPYISDGGHSVQLRPQRGHRLRTHIVDRRGGAGERLSVRGDVQTGIYYHSTKCRKRCSFSNLIIHLCALPIVPRSISAVGRSLTTTLCTGYFWYGIRQLVLIPVWNNKSTSFDCWFFFSSTLAWAAARALSTRSAGGNSSGR